MKLRSKVIRGSVVLMTSEALGYSASFARNMLLARLLTKVDFGVAASFALVIGMMELAGKLAIAQLVVQDREGDQPRFLATAQMLQFLAGCLSCLVILVAAPAVAAMLDLSDQAWAFRWLALLPLFKGLESLDVRRMGRELRFLPSSLVEMVPQVLITLAVWPLGVWLGDYRVVLVLLLAKGLLTLLGTHWLAERRYQWSFDRTIAQRVFRFGWPLLLNSFLMFGVLQGDQLLVGAKYSIADLAVYAAAALLTLVPGNMLVHVMSSLMLPILSRVQDDPAVFRRCYRLSAQIVTAFSVSYALGIIIGAESIMTLVFGQKYADGGVLLGWLAATNSLRLLRVAPALAALARADSKNQLISNLLRSTSLLAAAVVAFSGEPLWEMAAVGLLGEGLALAGTLYRLNRRDQIGWSDSLYPAAFLMVGLSAAGLLAAVGVHGWPASHSIGLGLILGLGSAALAIGCFPEARGQVLNAWANLRTRLPTRGLGQNAA